MNEQIIKRLQSFGWRLMVVTVTFILAWITDNIGLLELPLWIQAGLGTLILPELTKLWAVKMKLKGKTFLGRMIRPATEDKV